MNGIGITNVGMVRQNNEDAIFVTNEPLGILPNLYIVSDGMGGHSAGEVASNNSILFFTEFVKAANLQNLACEDYLDILVEGVMDTNRLVFEIALKNTAMKGMGATFSVCTIAEGRLYLAHVGDSRVYVIKPNKMTQVSTDHTYVQEMVKAGELTAAEAKTHPQRNIITRALGTSSELAVDGIVTEVTQGDFVLLCSDGLTNMVTDDEICFIAHQVMSVDAKCRTLVNLANQNGGDDNISVVLVEVNLPKISEVLI